MMCACGHDRAEHVTATAAERQGCASCECVVFTADDSPAHPFLDDGDVVLWHGDALERLRELPDDHVDCVVTSPPYFALRDYGTGRWEGGDPDCDHLRPLGGGTNGFQTYPEANTAEAVERKVAVRRQQYAGRCGKCGAERVDEQIGLEPTPEQFLEALVAVFREVRRVLSPRGVVWLNIGDSYNAYNGNRGPSTGISDGANGDRHHPEHGRGLVAPTAKPKDLLMMPARLALALQADGWWIRKDVIWHKPNPMPESATDRPTSSHEHVFMLTARDRYWYDAEASKEPVSGTANPRGRGVTAKGEAAGFGVKQNNSFQASTRHLVDRRNMRDVWTIPSQPSGFAHFATFPPELVRRALVAACPTRVCRVCGHAPERILKRKDYGSWKSDHGTDPMVARQDEGLSGGGFYDGYEQPETVGWTICGHGEWRTGRVLDPFMGTGTTAEVARNLGLHAVGIDLSTEYLGYAADRLRQLSLFAEV